MKPRAGPLAIALALALLTAPLAADAQQPANVYRIGVLWSSSPESPLARAQLDTLRQGLRGHGDAEERNITFEHR